VLHVSVAVALFDDDGVAVAVMVSTTIAISNHFTFPNNLAVSVTLTNGYTHRTDTYSASTGTAVPISTIAAAATNKRAFMQEPRLFDRRRRGRQNSAFRKCERCRDDGRRKVREF
jgi:hypothetical protein